MWLRRHWAPGCQGHVYHQINVARPGRWPEDDRVPDLVLATPERFAAIDREEYFEGGPEVVVEIRSPGDEAYEKLSFYAEVGVRDVWIVDREEKVGAIHVAAGGEMKARAAGADGWLTSEATGIHVRLTSSGKLAIRLAADAATSAGL